MSDVISQKDRELFRTLVKQYADVAFLDIHKKTIDNFKRLNGLKPARPAIMIDQMCWEEISGDSELEPVCENQMLRTIETRLRRELYKWRHFPCDMAFSPHIKISKVVRNTGIGVVRQNRSENALHVNASTHTFEDQLPDEEALKKMRKTTVTFDAEQTKYRENLLNDLIGDIIPVKLSGVTIWAAIWDFIVFLRGADTVLYDLADRPEFIHSIMRKYLEIEMDRLDQYEALNVLEPGQETIHCCGAYCDELPGEDFDPDHIKAKNCWVAGAAQIFSEVSPAMHDEFEIEYMKPYYERFGLVNYGCCEPLHHKIDIIRKIKNVRMISVSPWANVEVAAEAMGRDYVMARKSNPSFVAMDVFDEKLVIEETKETLKACYKNGTPCQFILKDITTVRKDPSRLTRWYEAVKTTIENF